MAVSTNTRRRPGALARPSMPMSSGNYDLVADRQLRARAAFLGQTLGEACTGVPDTVRGSINVTYRSLSAAEVADLRPNERLSDTEIELLYNIQNSNYSVDNMPGLPTMFKAEIHSLVLAGMLEQLTRARRARHAWSVIEHAERERDCPGNTTLFISPELAAVIPY